MDNDSGIQRCHPGQAGANTEGGIPDGPSNEAQGALSARAAGHGKHPSGRGGCFPGSPAIGAVVGGDEAQP